MADEKIISLELLEKYHENLKQSIIEQLDVFKTELIEELLDRGFVFVEEEGGE